MIAVSIEVDVSRALTELRAPLTDRPMMVALGSLQAALIKDRTVQHGRGLSGAPLKPYSTKPIYVSLTRGMGRRLKPKGGRRTKRGKGKTMFFAGGYAEYKAKSTKRRGASHVDYTASGRTMASLRVLRSSRNEATVGFSGGEARRIAAGLQARDAFFGVGKGDEEAITEEATLQVQRIIDSRRTP